jgi:hypothetical protein
MEATMARRAGAEDDDTIGQGTIGGEAQDGDTGGGAESISNGGGPSDELVMKYVAQMDAQQAEVDKWEAGKKGAQKGMTTIRQRAKADGVKLKNLDAAMKRRNLPRHEQRADLEEQDRYDLLLGNVTWEDADLFAAETATTIRDELDWEGQGYADGKRGLPPKAPANCPPEFHQAYLRTHAKGADELVAILGGQKPEDLVIKPDDGAKKK